MTEEQRDDLIEELSIYGPSQIRAIVAEYQQQRKQNNCNFPFYKFLREKLEIEGYWKKVGLAESHSRAGGCYACTIAG